MNVRIFPSLQICLFQDVVDLHTAPTCIHSADSNKGYKETPGFLSKDSLGRPRFSGMQTCSIFITFLFIIQPKNQHVFSQGPNLIYAN